MNAFTKWLRGMVYGKDLVETMGRVETSLRERGTPRARPSRSLARLDVEAKAAGLPGYPIPPMTATEPPTPIAMRSLLAPAAAGDELFPPSGPCTCGHDGLPAPWHPYPCPHSRAARLLDARAAASFAAEGDTVTDDHHTSTPADSDEETATYTGIAPVADLPADAYDSAKGGVSDAQEWAAAPAADPLTDSGVHHLDGPPAERRTIRAACEHCEGHGYMDRTINDLLRETIARIPVDGGDQMIRTFYTHLLTAAPHLAPLFPRDLCTAATQDGASPGAMQRDKLLSALVALAELDVEDPGDQERLDTALSAFGRSHAAFARPDGSVQGATEAEYDLVGKVLMDTLAQTLGGQWTVAHQQAWQERYSYAKVVMLYAQYHSGMKAPRFPRRDAARE